MDQSEGKYFITIKPQKSNIPIFNKVAVFVFEDDTMTLTQIAKK
jgi:hypothetical protein